MTAETRPSADLNGEIHVLHVDDNTDLAELTATALERESDRLTVEIAASAANGLERLAAASIDCIVSDYEMPGRNGIEFLEAVRVEQPDLPFILFTGRGSEDVASDAISAGVTDYLQKDAGKSQYAVLANRIENVVSRHRSELAMTDTQERLSRFIEQSPLGVLEYDRDFEIVRVNAAAEEIFGYSEHELRGQSWEAIVTPESYENVDSLTDALQEARGGFHSIDENVRKDGETIICEWHNHVITDADDEVVAIFSQVQDITERIERERRYERSSARLEALFDNSPDMINTHDTEGTILDPNPQFCAQLAYDAEELRGMKVWEVDRSLDAESAHEIWRDMAIGDKLRLESRYVRRDGSTFPVEVHVRRLDLEGEDRFVVISRDVSEKEERTQKLELKERAMDAAPIGISISDATMDDNPLIYVNRGFLRQTGYDESEVIGRNCRFLQGPNTDQAAVDEMRNAIDAAEPVNVELRNYRRDGSEYWNQVTIAPIEDEDGEVTNFVGFQQEITERKEQEREVERQNERLEQFANMVSHDLRNPLNVAQGRLHLVREERDSEDLEAVATAHERMEALIQALLTLARQGTPVDDLETVSIGTLAEACWRVVETGEATLVVEEDVTFLADEDRLRQLLENLVRNSIDHGGDDVTVTLGALDSGRGFFVEDDGVGIPPDDRDQIFESGFSTTPEGTGFGLAIVAEIVEAHDWHIEVLEGRVGGARFEISGVDVQD